MCRFAPPESPDDFRNVKPGGVIRVDEPQATEPFLQPSLLELERFAYTPMGTFGRLRMPEFECYTVERPWFNNVPRESCIPCGTYPLDYTVYNRGGYPTLEIHDVPGRSLIKIHAGNTMDDVLGCIALGRSLGMVGDPPKWAVLNSRFTYEAWWKMILGVCERWSCAVEDIRMCGEPTIRIMNTPPGGLLHGA